MVGEVEAMQNPNRLLLGTLVLLLIISALMPSFECAGENGSSYLTIATNASVYKPGDEVILTVHYQNGSINATIEVDDPTDTPIIIYTATTDATGTVTISFNLSTNAVVGTYGVYASAVDACTSTTFEVISESALSISASDITFSALAPKPGETVRIYALVHNQGQTTATGEVAFYDGNPAADGVQIGSMTIAVASGDAAIAFVDWIATLGNHTIFVVVDNTVTYESTTAVNKISVGADVQPILVLTTGDINVFRFEPEETRTVCVKVTCYQATVHNVTLRVLDDQNLSIELLTPPLTMCHGETMYLYLRIRAPGIGGAKTLEFDIIIQAVGDDGVYSNVESMDIVVSESAVDFISPTIILIAGATGIAAGGLGIAGYFLHKNEYLKYGLISLFIPLYTKIKASDGLDQFTRGQIYGHIRTHPGTHYNHIKKTLGLKNGTLTYHLQVLERAGYIRSVRDGNLKRFYDAIDRGFSEHRSQRPHLTEIQTKIIDIIEQMPGVTQTKLAEVLEQSRQSINYNIKQLTKHGIIQVVSLGRATHCYLTQNRAQRTPSKC